MITGCIVAVIFWIISDYINIFHEQYGGTIFIDMLAGLSILGSYLGAGYVGWRVVDKYYHAAAKHFIRKYKKYSLFSFLLLVIVIYSPLSILAFLWSILAPYCVVMALNNAKKEITQH